VDGGDAVLLRQEVGELLLGDGALLHQERADAAAALLLLFLGLLQLLQRDQVLADKEFTEPTGHEAPLPVRAIGLNGSRAELRENCSRGFRRGSRNGAPAGPPKTPGVSLGCARRALECISQSHAYCGEDFRPISGGLVDCAARNSSAIPALLAPR